MLHCDLVFDLGLINRIPQNSWSRTDQSSMNWGQSIAICLVFTCLGTRQRSGRMSRIFAQDYIVYMVLYSTNT
jgi:hypothetical protein